MGYAETIQEQIDHFGLTPIGIPNGVSFGLKGRNYTIKILEQLGTDFGSCPLEYDLKGDKWSIGESDDPDVSGIMEAVKVDKFVQRSWGRYGAPRLYTIDRTEFSPADVRYDVGKFKNAFFDVPQNLLFRFYGAKHIHYIQVAGYGFYHLDKDPAGIGSAPFNLGLRASIYLQRESQIPLNNYSFDASLKVMRKPMRSDYNLEDNADFIARLA